MTLRFIDPIWHIRGTLALADGQSRDEAFDRLAPLFGEYGTSHQRQGDTLSFQKKDQAAQDKMSVFDDGVLQIERGAKGPVLRYNLTSRILLFCFLAPLMFLGIAQLAIAIGEYEQPAAGAHAKASKAVIKPAPPKAEVPMSPVDKFLGAPAPEKPKKGEADKDDGGRKKPSPTPAYVFAAIFAVLYVTGRILEDRLIRTLFRKRLHCL